MYLSQGFCSVKSWERNLKYGVLVLVLGCVSCGVFPWNPEAHLLPVQPHQTRVSPAVHLSDQPGLQADTPRGDRHPAWGEAHRPVSPPLIINLIHLHNCGTAFINSVTNNAVGQILHTRILQTFEAARPHLDRRSSCLSQTKEQLTLQASLHVEGLFFF